MAGMTEGIRYARAGGLAIGYQVVGAGAADLVYVPDFVSNLVYGWEGPYWRPFYDRLAQSFRLILFDKRGTGLSDHGPHFAALETRMEDIRLVLDAAGSSSAVVFAAHEGCAMAVLYAATYPERLRALVLFHPLAKAPGSKPARSRTSSSELRDQWGTQDYCDTILREGCPTLDASEEYRHWFANWLRVSASPAVAYALNRAFSETDLTEVLPAVRVPTLVLYRRAPSTRSATRSTSRRASPRPRDARLRKRLPGPFLSLDIADEIERFVAGEDERRRAGERADDVMFTDLVGSTERVAALGDRGWRDLLAQHHSLVRRELARFRGEERDTAGDGFFATFDGPARAIRAGEAIVEGVGRLGLGVRCGIHVGECELHDGKPAGISVVIGSRVMAAAETGEILITSTVRDLVAGSDLQFTDRGERALKGVPGRWSLYAVDGSASR